MELGLYSPNVAGQYTSMAGSWVVTSLLDDCILRYWYPKTQRQKNLSASDITSSSIVYEWLGLAATTLFVLDAWGLGDVHRDRRLRLS